MSSYLLLTTEKDVNTQDWYREHIHQHQIVTIQHRVSRKSYQGIKTQAPVPAPPALGFHSPLQLTAERAQTPLPHTPFHLQTMACCSLHFITDQQNCSQTHAPAASPPPSSQKGDKMHDNEGRLQPDQFHELSPTESHSGPTKDAALWQLKLICISAALFSLFSFPPALHSYTRPCASAGICLTCQPVQGAIPAKNYSTPFKRCFLPGQLPWTASLWAGALSAPLCFCSLNSTTLVWEIAMNPQSKGAADCRSKKEEGKVNYLSHFYCQMH